MREYDTDIEDDGGDEPWIDSEGEIHDDEDDDDDESRVVPCPHCGAEVFEEAERCPICGDYVTHTRAAWVNKPWWWVVLGLLGIAAVILTSFP